MTAERWEKLTGWPLTAAALVYLAAYSVEVLAQPRGASAVAVEAVIWVTWALFAIDYAAQLLLAQERWVWFRRHLLDLLVVVLPMLRPLRLLRLVTILSVVQRSAGTALRGRIIVYVSGASVLLIYVAALAVLDAERGAGGPIQTFPDALWWAFVTVTTVGYGDYFPVTGLGRFVAAGLMVGGIALIGVVTATLASWIVERVGAESQESGDAVARLAEEVSELRRAVEREDARGGDGAVATGSGA
ncbi:potassium channel family protein [Microbacterium album]|uniref:Voltage-gated potassium channel n=1 Tax=Microbacterium album TaxID=2053191 RepID=A0A917IGG7_9MICO|nr:potassium channel family protein [Microbacterium album]GGH47529.1 voltage-gated potassium channel [Microbacterium album]